MPANDDTAGVPQLAAPRAGERRSAAVALAYGAGDVAPRVLAKGRGLIAEAIITRARESDIYVHESPDLVSLLMQVDIDQHIPPELYVAVAEVLAWLYRHDRGSGALLPDASRDIDDRNRPHGHL